MAKTSYDITDKDFYTQFGREIKRDIKPKEKDLIENIEDEFPDPMEFKRKLIRFNDSIQKIGNISTTEYIRAVYFCSLYALGKTQVDCYRKVFPERVVKKNQNTSSIGNSASIYFNSMLVQSIWKQVTVADHMLFLDTRFKAYGVLEEIMMNSKAKDSDRIDAAGKLANLLRPPKEAEVRVNIGFQSQEIKSLEEKLGQMADLQLNQLQLGHIDNKDIVEAELFEKDEE